MAEAHSVALDQLLTPIEGGWRVQNAAEVEVHILKMMYGNLRIVTLDRMGCYSRGWCYQAPLLEVLIRALAFNPDRLEEPIGWVKEAGTERRACGLYFPNGSYAAHDTFEPTCEYCGNEPGMPENLIPENW